MVYFFLAGRDGGAVFSTVALKHEHAGISRLAPFSVWFACSSHAFLFSFQAFKFA